MEERFTEVHHSMLFGAAFMESGKMAEAGVLFDNANSRLYEISLEFRNEPTLDLSTLNFTAPFNIMKDSFHGRGTQFWEKDGFYHHFIPVSCDTSSTTKSISISESFSKLTAWTMTALYNSALCNQLEGVSNKPHLLRDAIERYENVLSVSYQCLSSCKCQESIVFLQMAVFMNLSDCYASLGKLDESFQWILCLKAVVDLCERTKPHFLSMDLFSVFRVAAKIRSRHVSAGAA